MIEKTTRINSLFDFYQDLLTPKQKNYMTLYYLEDLSLGEIAEQYDVSRQAVYDNIKRTEVLLENYEEKLALYEKYQKKQELLEELEEFLKIRLDSEDFQGISTVLKKLKELD